MNSRFLLPLSIASVILLARDPSQAAELALRQVRETSDPARAIIRVRAGERSPFEIPRAITGKFAEHLGYNIYNGMDAQILRNPTFADYPFWNGQMTPDGVTKFHTDVQRINEELHRQATRFGWPEPELDALTQARADALATFWTRVGPAREVVPSPDTGPHGGRAQRVHVQGAGQGIAQWTWLPLHRQRRFEVKVMARSPGVRSLTATLSTRDSATPLASVKLAGLSPDWSKLKGELTLPGDAPADASYKFSLTSDAPGQWVVRHVFLRPADHIQGADPDVVKFLKESNLSLLRWPGGNFVSTYHWEDGVGPVERRPTKPNYAWGAIEPNTFGTAEFIAFCRAVGCEPMICVNAGSGSPDEAARWIEYCNGPATSPMGRLRAAHGHPEPFAIRHWEAGNELWGKWQMHWTTAQGNVDRWREFSKAMLAADRNILLYACGAPAMWGKEWNDTLVSSAGASIRSITDHPLIGGDVPPSTEPLDVYRDFMAVPEVLQQKWVELRASMLRSGIPEPRLAVTELQLFAHLRGDAGGAPVRLTRDTLPSQASITEAIYDTLIYHAAIRLAPFVEMVTHSATVNHGGGLRKERERVWANPCHYAQAAFAAFGGATPVATEIESAVERAPLVLPDLRSATTKASYSAIDALAALDKDGALLISIVHRGTAGPVRLAVQFDDFKPGPTSELQILTADAPWEGNSLNRPDRIQPANRAVPVTDGAVELEIPPYSVLRLRTTRAEG